MENLKIPSVIHCSFDLGSKFLFYGCFIFFSLFAVGLPMLIDEKMTLGLVFAVIIFALISLLCFYMIIMVDFLKKYYIILGEEGISIKTSFRKEKTFKWKEIYTTGFVTINGNTSIGFILKKDLKEDKQSIGKNINRMLGAPDFSYQFPIRLFGTLNHENFIKLILDKLDSLKANEEIGNWETSNENKGRYEVEENPSILKALFYSIITLLASIIIEVFFITAFNMKILIIPIIGAMLIIAVFDKFYPRRNIFSRLLKGIYCFVQAPLSMIISLMWMEYMPFTPTNFIILTKEYIQYVSQNIFADWLTILTGIVCFFMGVLINTNKNN